MRKKQVVDAEVYKKDCNDGTGQVGGDAKWDYKFYAYFGNSEVRVTSDIHFSSKKAAVRAAYNMAAKLDVFIFRIIEAYE